MSGWKRVAGFLRSEHSGFSGVTHWLVAMMLTMLLMLYAPSATPFITDMTERMSQSRLDFLMFVLLIGGGSLLPDLDSSPLEEGGSTAVYQLGFLGHALSAAAIMISGVVWGVLHTSNDRVPPSQHRMLFHTPFMAVLLLWWAGTLPPIGIADALHDIMESGSVLIMAMLCTVATYLGTCMATYRVPLRIVQNHVQLLSFLSAGLFLLSQWKSGDWAVAGMAVATGYAFHIVADLFSKGSVPLFFPVPTPVRTKSGTAFRLWWKPHPFGGRFQVTTGGAVNILLNFVIGGLDLLLAMLLLRGWWS